MSTKLMILNKTTKSTLKATAAIIGMLAAGALIAIALHIFMWAAYTAGIPM